MGRRVVLAMTLVVVVLTYALPAVAAPSEEAVPTGFTGRAHVGGEDDDCASRVEIVGAVHKDRDSRCEGWMGTTDPRFTGTYVVTRNADTYHDTVGALEDGSFTVSTVVRRVENGDGAWETPSTVEAWWLPESEGEQAIGLTETLVFTGEGSYEGLTAVLWMNPYIVGSQLWGAIFQGEPPPAPSDTR